MSDCGCNDITTTPCTSGTGCTSSNYAKCILYSGTSLTDCVEVTNGDNLDTVIAAIVTAICALTPADLAWNTFNYDCLGPYASAQAFAEGISAAHCALVTRVEDLETPTFTLCPLFTSGAYTITPGTTTLQDILGFYADILCDLSDNNPATITVSNYCFTSNSGIDTLELWLTWIVENVCSIRTSLLASIATETARITAIQTYLGTAGTLASKHDMSCVGGGATETAYASIEMLRDEVCAINTTLSAMPDLNAITLSWAACYAYGATDTLSTQLGRIVSVLKLQKYTFSSDFTVVSGACGNTVSLAASVGAFACSDLAGCSVHNLGDVDPTLPTIAECGYRLTWDNVNGYYKLVKNSTFTNVGIQAKSGVYVGEPNGFYFKNQTTPLDCSQPLDYFAGFVEDEWLDLTPYLDADYQETGANYTPHIKKTWDGHIMFKGALESVGSPAIGAPEQPMSNGSYTTVATGIPAAYRPTVNSFIDIIVEYPHDTSGAPNANLNAFVPGKLLLTSTGTLQIRCHETDIAALVGTTYDGDHNFMLTGKAIYQ